MWFPIITARQISEELHDFPLKTAYIYFISVIVLSWLNTNNYERRLAYYAGLQHYYRRNPNAPE